MKLSTVNTFSDLWNVIRDNYRKTKRCIVYAYGGCDNLLAIDRLYDNARDIDVRFVAVINPHRLPIEDLFDYAEKLMRIDRVLLLSVVWFRDNEDLKQLYEERQLTRWIEDINNCGQFGAGNSSMSSLIWPNSVDEEKSTIGYGCYRENDRCDTIVEREESIESNEESKRNEEERDDKRHRDYGSRNANKRKIVEGIAGNVSGGGVTYGNDGNDGNDDNDGNDGNDDANSAKEDYVSSEKRKKLIGSVSCSSSPSTSINKRLSRQVLKVNKNAKINLDFDRFVYIQFNYNCDENLNSSLIRRFFNKTFMRIKKFVIVDCVGLSWPKNTSVLNENYIKYLIYGANRYDKF